MENVVVDDAALASTVEEATEEEILVIEKVELDVVSEFAKNTVNVC